MGLRCPHCKTELRTELVLAAVSNDDERGNRSTPPEPDRPPLYDNQGWNASRPSPGSSQPKAPAAELAELLKKIDDRILPDREREFVVETRERFSKYHGATRMSPKQTAWLRKIAGRYDSHPN